MIIDYLNLIGREGPVSEEQRKKIESFAEHVQSVLKHYGINVNIRNNNEKTE